MAGVEAKVGEIRVAEGPPIIRGDTCRSGQPQDHQCHHQHRQLLGLQQKCGQEDYLSMEEQMWKAAMEYWKAKDVVKNSTKQLYALLCCCFLNLS